MPVFERFDSVSSVPQTSAHHDAWAFPSDLSWFCLLENHVLASASNTVVYRATSRNGANSVTIPLVRDRRGLFGGVMLKSLQNFYTPDYRPICTHSASNQLIGVLVDHLIDVESPDLVCLSPVDPDAPETHSLEEAFKARGFAMASSSSSVNWIHEVDGDYAHYISSRPKRVQNTLKRRTRNLLAISAVSIEVWDGTKDLPRLLAWYEHVYARSWKVPEPFPGFMPALITKMAQSGQLRLGFVELAGRPIAVHFWIVRKGCAFIYKLAHDQEFDKMSPGTVLMATMMQHVIEKDGVTRIDFLTGDDAYKRDWMSVRRVKTELKAYNSGSARGLALLGLEQHLKPFVKQLWNRSRATPDVGQRAVNYRR